MSGLVKAFEGSNTAKVNTMREHAEVGPRVLQSTICAAAGRMTIDAN